jgi:hypothetical protein
MKTIIDHFTNVQVYAMTSIALGQMLSYWLKRRNYNRIMGITGGAPLPYFWALVIGLLEWFGTWLYRLLIAFGVFFLVLVWYNHRSAKPPLNGGGGDAGKMKKNRREPPPYQGSAHAD